MADVNRGNRPLSPHLTIYRPQLNSAMSIFHRISGIGLGLAAILVVWWFLAAASGAEYFQFVDDLITSWIIGLAMLLAAFALWYHLFNGIRHLFWDAGLGMEMDMVDKSGIVTLAAAALATFVTAIVGWI